MLVRVLLVLSEASTLKRIERLLSERSVMLSVLGPDEDLLQRLGRRSCDIVLASRTCLPEPSPALVREIRALPDRPEIIVLVSREDSADRTSLLNAGCLALLSERISDRDLGQGLRLLIRRKREDAMRHLRAENWEDSCRFSDFITSSSAMAGFLAEAGRVAASDSSLLILGETGVGKERLARAIHNEGPRRAGPFLAVNCAALPEQLLESELFGHEMGAFTGAVRSRRGYFELAHRGTLFLDEIAEIPPHLQVKLLRFLQDRRLYPLGAEESIGVDVRVMAATNRDLPAEMSAGRFRADLFYRLGVVTLTVPPLRERREDIETLAVSYVEHFRVRTGRPASGIEPDAVAALIRYPWPGNVRELINVIERAVLLCTGTAISIRDLPLPIAGVMPSPNPEPPPRAAAEIDTGRPSPSSCTLPWAAARRQALHAFEDNYFRTLLLHSGGRIGEAARIAAIDPRSLYEKIKRLGLRKVDFRPEPGTEPRTARRRGESSGATTPVRP